MNGVMYLRVSSAEQLREGFSIPAQRALLVEYAERHGITIVAEFSDDETAKTTGRRDFSRMVEHLKKNPTHEVLVEKVDRLYRNPKDYIAIDDLKVKIHFAKEGGLDRGDSDGRFMHWIRVGMARKYVENLSEEVRKGMTRKCEEGGWPTWAPLGYLNVKDERGRAVIVRDPAKAALVQEIFEAAATGSYSLADLVRLAQRIGLRGRRNQWMTKPTIAYIVTNLAYTGSFNWGGKRYVGGYDPLITMDVFMCVQRALAAGSRPKTQKHVFAYTGMVRCAKCNGLLTGNLKKGRYVYYSCRGAKGCKRYFEQREFDAIAVQHLRALRIDAEIAEFLLASLTRWYDTATTRISAKVGRIKARLTEIGQMSAKAYEDKLLGRIGEEGWREAAERWAIEASDLKMQLAMAKPAIERAEFLRRVTEPLELAQIAADQYIAHGSTDKGILLRKFCQNLIVDGANISIELRSPFDVLMRVAKGGGWLGSVSQVRTVRAAFIRLAIAA